MSYEVEMKFALDDISSFLASLQKYGATLEEAVEEKDVFYQHPARDFAKTDEGLRIRHRNGEYFITYKGPKIESTTKTRREIEIPLHCDEKEAENWDALFRELGFEPAGTVVKSRRTSKLRFEGCDFVVTLDHLENLGDFVEIETRADEVDLDYALALVHKLAQEVSLTTSIRTSYLEMVLEKKSI